MKFDLHCHTKEGSFDSRIPISEYICKYKILGYDGFMITDHNSYRGCMKSRNVAVPDGFTILRGIEYDTKDAGHVLIVLPDGVYPYVLRIRGMRLSKLTGLVHHLGGVIGLAHPFGIPSSSAMGFKLMKMDYIEDLDFIEIFNTCEKEISNKLARELADKFNLPGIGGTDAHDGKYIGTAYTEIDYNIKNNNDFIEAIVKRSHIEVVGKERERTRRDRLKDMWFSQLGYRLYNRGLSKAKMPRRKLSHKNLLKHRPHSKHWSLRQKQESD